MKLLSNVLIFLATISVTSTAAAQQAVAPSVGDQRDTSARGDEFHVTAALSPYHFGFPLFNVLLEQHLSRHFGVAQELGFGSYATAGVGQLGLRVNLYPREDFRGVQFGLVSRANLIVYPGPEAVLTHPSEAAEAVEVVSHDVQLARANGRDSLFLGGYVGGKAIAGRSWGAARGFTFILGAQAGYVHLFGASPYGPSPDAAFIGDKWMVLLEVRLGWSL
jgi:hypothetical protein